MLGQKRKGVEFTGKYLKKYIENEFHDVPCKNISKNINKNKIKYLTNNLSNLYNANIFFDKKINIGGDHSMAIATVADSLNRVPKNKLKVVWFDAHADINTYSSSNTKNFHGMPLSFLSKLDKQYEFPFIVNTLNLKNLIYVGIRDLDMFEEKIINKYGINYIQSDELNNKPEKTLKEIKKFVNNDPFHLSFDVDVMDPSIIPSTGTPVNHGLLLDQTKFVIDELKNDNLINMDITELNLNLGNKNEQNKSLNNFLNLFNNYLDIKAFH